LSAVVVLSLPTSLNPIVVWILAAVMGMVAGAVLGAISGLAKAFLSISEMISSFLVSAITLNVCDYFITGTLQDPTSNFQTTAQIPERFLLPKIFYPSKLDSALWLAVVLVVLAYFLAARSRLGFELKVYGESEEFARYCGIHVHRYEIGAMVVLGSALWLIWSCCSLLDLMAA